MKNVFLPLIVVSGLVLDRGGAIPVAYDYGCSYGSCSSTFHDFFDGTTDLTGFVRALSAADNGVTASTDTAG